MPLLPFAADRLSVKPSQIDLAQIDARLVLESLTCIGGCRPLRIPEHE
jgi:hypothetical protein